MNIPGSHFFLNLLVGCGFRRVSQVDAAVVKRHTRDSGRMCTGAQACDSASTGDGAFHNGRTLA